MDDAVNMGRSAITWLLIIVALGATLFALSSKFAHKEVSRQNEQSSRPRVTGSRPANSATNVAPVIGVVADITLPNTGAGVDPKTLEAGVSLIRVSDGSVVPSRKNTSGAGDVIVLKPINPLEKNVQYKFAVTAGLKDTSGAEFSPYAMSFTTTKDFAESEFPAAFEKVELKQLTLDQNAFTSLAIGPDGMLYAGTFAGMIYRFEINPDGTLAPRAPIMSILQNSGGPRLVTGIAFDPKSTKENPILWINHGQMAITPEGKLEGAEDWTGKLSRISGSNYEKYEDILIHLPRAYKDHLNFQIAFGADGALYFTQGSHTSVGEIDKKWGYRPERKLSAAVLRLDVAKLNQLPLDVKTEEGGTYDPSASDAPLTLFSTGIRSGFDLLLHRNGKLYSGINGAGGNEGNTPGSADGKIPALRDFKSTTNDMLIRIEKGKYYGHPNPTRNEYTLNGGNPTKDTDPMEVSEYPVGIQPDKNYQPPAYDFGKNYSPNGLIEYKGASFGGALDGCILVTRYSDGKDILVLRLNAAGDVVETIAGIEGFTGFIDPLDLLEDDKTGNIYVAEYGGRTISLLKPVEGKVSKATQLTTVTPH